MQWLNLTPHAIVVYDNDNVIASIEPANPGKGARVVEKTRVTGVIENIPIIETDCDNSELEGMPPLSEMDTNTRVIVSLVVANYIDGLSHEGRKRLWPYPVWVPNTGPDPMGAVRNESGQIVGVRSFKQFA